MSADNITACPGCGDYTLREYDTHCGIRENTEGKFVFIIPNYYAVCKSCNWGFWRSTETEEIINAGQ
jgi:hypothetical protein